jgi:glycerol-3-phosphate dehydrogenase
MEDHSMNGNTYDVVIIGGGVIGSSIARALSKYECRTVLLEKEEDVCSGTSKANSAIVHAGYDAKTGSLKAKLNVKGNAMMGDLSKELDFDFKRNSASRRRTSRRCRHSMREAWQTVCRIFPF